MLLEEALNGLTGDPADISRAFLLFLKQEYPVGGVDAEYRFHQKLYPLLLKSIFGPLEKVTDVEAGCYYRHLSGGWLSRQHRWNVISQKQQQTQHQQQHTNEYLLSIDPVVLLLSPPPLAAPKRAGRTVVGGGESVSKAFHSSASTTTSTATTTLFAPTTTANGGRRQQGRPEAVVDSANINVLSLIQKSYGNYFEHPFLALTRSSQHVLMEILYRQHNQQQQQQQQQQQFLIGSCNRKMLLVDDIFVDENTNNNEVTVYSALLQIKPVEQRGLMELFQLITFGPPTTTTTTMLTEESSPLQLQQQQKFQNLVQEKKGTTVILLSAWEKFFFLFLHFPFTKPITATKIIQPTQREPYGDLVYFHLFKLYINYFLPPHHLDDTYAYKECDFRPQSELFIRLIIDFWITSRIIVVPTASSNSVATQEQPPSQTTNLSDVYDKIPWMIDGSSLSTAPQQPYYPSMVLKCLQYLILHVCSDPFLEQSSSSCYENENNYTINDSLLYDVLSPPLIVLQPHMYKFILTSFKYAPIVSPSKLNTTPSLFFIAVDLWLTWMEPWNHTYKLSTAGKILTHISPYGYKQHPSFITPKPIAPSKFTQQWQFYIASNAHLYITLFATFLRRAREFDFSQQNFKTSIELVLRVTRVFSKEVCTVLQRSFSSSVPSLLKQLRVEHEGILGQRTANGGVLFPSSVNLHDCKLDAQAMLEEIYFQHFKKKREMNLLDRLDDKIEGMTGSGGTKYELQLADRVKDQLCSIVGIQDYQYTGNKQLLDSRLHSTRQLPQTAANGITLTTKGREEIVRGKKTFAPQDVKYLGDPMKARVRSYEIGFLVHWCVMASNWINFKLGLDKAGSKLGNSTPPSLLGLIEETEKTKKIWFRFNLRFLADYRNLLFFACLVFIYKVIKCLF